MDVGSAEVPEQRPSERGRDLKITMGKMSCPLSSMFPAQQHRCMLLVLSLSSSVAVSFKVLRGLKLEKNGPRLGNFRDSKIITKSCQYIGS